MGSDNGNGTGFSFQDTALPVLILLLISSISSGELIRSSLLVEGVDRAIILPDGRILVEPDFGIDLYTIDPATGDTSSWVMDWSPEEDGWGLGGYYDLDVSPDGRWVLAARVLYVNDYYPDPWPGRDATGLILSRPDGSEARGISLGGGPLGGDGPWAEFTGESDLVVGNCISFPWGSPEEYSEWYHGPRLMASGKVGVFALDAGEFQAREYPLPNMGERVFPSLSSICMPNPSGVLAVLWEPAEITDYLEIRRLDFEGSVIGYSPEDPGGDFPYCYPLIWVSETEVMVQEDGIIVILDTTGMFRKVPAEIESWMFYHVFPDGSLLFRRNPDQLPEYGIVNWETFEVDTSRYIRGLDGLLSPFNRFTTLGGDSLLILNSGILHIAGPFESLR